jgi:site-specific recombinase XerD
MEGGIMRMTSTSRTKGKKNRPKTKLGIPDLEHSKTAVLRSLGSPDSRRGYQQAIDEFVAWYCSEPRLAFNKTVVLRYRFHLEERGLASGTINVRMAAVRRLAFEAADSGLLSPELAAGIHRVRKLGSRLGNWLTAGEASALLQVPNGQTLTGKRNRAILAVLLGWGLRRRELAELTLESLQRREERWAIVDLIGKGRHIRTVPVPSWVKETLDAWLTAAEIEKGPLFRCVCRAGKLWGDGISEKTVWHVAKKAAANMNMPRLAPHDLRRSCARLCHDCGGQLEQIQFLLGACFSANNGTPHWLPAAF